jgi:predicted enzyme related to lactoylglutathione lyase
MAKVTGIGGIFFKCDDPDRMKEWYSKNLGLNTDEYGTNFEWRQSDDPEKKGFTQWSVNSKDAKYADSTDQKFMINYRVDNLVEMVAELKEKGVRIVDEIEEFDYGKFVHIIDAEGNRVELWEPNDEEYDKIVDGRTK